MRKGIFVLLFGLLMCVPAYAQFGNLINNLKSSQLFTQQKPIQDVLAKVQSISAIFAQLPLNSGKLEIIKAALPLLAQTNSVSAHLLAMIQQGKTPDAAGTNQISGLLDQVKALLQAPHSAAPLTPDQIPQANAQVQQFSGLLTSLLKNEGDSLKGLMQLPLAH